MWEATLIPHLCILWSDTGLTVGKLSNSFAENKLYDGYKSKGKTAWVGGGEPPYKKDGTDIGNFEKNALSYQDPVLREWLEYFSPLSGEHIISCLIFGLCTLKSN